MLFHFFLIKILSVETVCIIIIKELNDQTHPAIFPSKVSCIASRLLPLWAWECAIATENHTKRQFVQSVKQRPSLHQLITRPTCANSTPHNAWHGTQTKSNSIQNKQPWKKSTWNKNKSRLTWKKIKVSLVCVIVGCRARGDRFNSTLSVDEIYN